MVGNFVVRQRVSEVIQRNFRPYNRWYTSPNEHFEYGYPHSNAYFNIYSSKAQHYAPNWSFVSNVKQLCQPITSDVTHDIGTPRVYGRIYRHKSLTLSNQTSCYICKCIRMEFMVLKHHFYLKIFKTDHLNKHVYTPPQNIVLGGILFSACPSFCDSESK